MKCDFEKIYKDQNKSTATFKNEHNFFFQRQNILFVAVLKVFLPFPFVPMPLERHVLQNIRTFIAVIVVITISVDFVIYGGMGNAMHFILILFEFNCIQFTDKMVNFDVTKITTVELKWRFSKYFSFYCVAHSTLNYMCMYLANENLFEKKAYMYFFA